MIIENMLRNAGMDPLSILGGEELSESLDEGKDDYNFKLYNVAQKADGDFLDAVKKQFGKRYQYKIGYKDEYNDKTMTAFNAKVKADAAWMKEMRKNRNEDIDGDIEEARIGGIVAGVYIVSTKVDEYGIPFEYEARLYDIAKQVPMDPGLGVKSRIKGKSGYAVLDKMAANWKRSGFLD